VVLEIVKLFTFFTDDQTTWSQIIVRDVLRAALLGMQVKNKLYRKFILSMIHDISTSPIAVKIIKEIPWGEGLGRLITQGFLEEPVCVSIIVNNLHRVSASLDKGIGCCDSKPNGHNDAERPN